MSKDEAEIQVELKVSSWGVSVFGIILPFLFIQFSVPLPCLSLSREDGRVNSLFD